MVLRLPWRRIARIKKQFRSFRLSDQIVILAGGSGAWRAVEMTGEGGRLVGSRREQVREPLIPTRANFTNFRSPGSPACHMGNVN